MKRLGSTDSLGALISVYASAADGQNPRNGGVYSRDFQSILGVLDEDAYAEDNGQVGEKKRRLSVEQVKALEKNFETENKLEPERKVKLAKELGLQPRQVAVWFQNRRARWKTKQLERDYGILKTNYDSLKLNYEALQKENGALLAEIEELRSKLGSENDGDCVEDDETAVIESLRCDVSVVMPSEVKDVSSESDSSAVMQEENSSNAANSSCGILQATTTRMTTSTHFHASPLSSFKFSSSASSQPPATPFFAFAQKAYQPQFVRTEEHNFLGAEDSCSFFSDEQAPAMPWFSSDQWS